jgi:hypothetical protein
MVRLIRRLKGDGLKLERRGKPMDYRFAIDWELRNGKDMNLPGRKSDGAKKYRGHDCTREDK